MWQTPALSVIWCNWRQGHIILRVTACEIMSVQTLDGAGASTASKSKHSRKRTHDQSSLSQSQSQASSTTAMPADREESPTKKPRRSLGNVKLTVNPAKTLSKTSRKDSANTSPFKTQRSAFYLPLSPSTSHKGLALPGLCAEHLSPLLLTYYAPLRGVILAYSDASLSTAPPTDAVSADAEDGTPLARSIDEYGTPYVWLTATFTLLAPAKGTQLRGYPSVFSEQHVGLLCYNLFNAHVGFEKMPADWSWVPAGEAAASRKSKGGHDNEDNDDESGGHWVDGAGKRISLDDELSFTVVDFESVGLGAGSRDRGFLTLEGTMREDEADVQPSSAVGRASINGENEANRSKKRKDTGTKPSKSNDY